MSFKTKYVCALCDTDITEGKRVKVTLLSPSWNVEDEMIFHHKCLLRLFPKFKGLRLLKKILH